MLIWKVDHFRWQLRVFFEAETMTNKQIGNIDKMFNWFKRQISIKAVWIFLFLSDRGYPLAFVR